MSYERNTDYKEISLEKTTITKLQETIWGASGRDVRYVRPGPGAGSGSWKSAMRLAAEENYPKGIPRWISFTDLPFHRSRQPALKSVRISMSPPSASHAHPPHSAERGATNFKFFPFLFSKNTKKSRLKRPFLHIRHHALHDGVGGVEKNKAKKKGQAQVAAPWRAHGLPPQGPWSQISGPSPRS